MALDRKTVRALSEERVEATGTFEESTGEAVETLRNAMRVALDKRVAYPQTDESERDLLDGEDLLEALLNAVVGAINSPGDFGRLVSDQFAERRTVLASRQAKQANKASRKKAKPANSNDDSAPSPDGETEAA